MTMQPNAKDPFSPEALLAASPRSVEEHDDIKRITTAISQIETPETIAETYALAENNVRRLELLRKHGIRIQQS
jgi:hypothetical protein